MHVVLINGPAGAGKNTLANQIKPLLFRLNGQAPARIASIGVEEFKQPLIDMLYAFAESLSVIEMRAPRSDALYIRLKEERMLGLTGREWMITWGDAMRAKNPNVLIDFLTTKARNMNLDVLIAPDCGFWAEVNGIRGRFGEDNVTVIYLDGWKPNVVRYNHGEIFHGDIRQCLRGIAHIENPLPEVAAQYVFDSIRAKQAQMAMDF